MIAVTRDEMLRWAQTRGATVVNMCSVLKCNTYRYYKLRKEDHWLATAALMEAAHQCLRNRGHVGLQTTLLHFTGEP